MKKLLSATAAIIILSSNIHAQPFFESFEFLYFTNDIRANRETDQRITFLRQYGDYARAFFHGPELDTRVVTDQEAEDFLKGSNRNTTNSTKK